MPSLRASALGVLFLAGLQGGCALLYDFADDDDAGGAGSAATSTLDAVASGSGTSPPGTSSAATIDGASATAASVSSSSTGLPWVCTTNADCFGGACDSGTCAPATTLLPGASRGLHVFGPEESVSVIYDDVGQFPGIRVWVVDASGPKVATANVGTSPAAATSFVAHDVDEIVMPLPGFAKVYLHKQQGWGGPADLTLQPPSGVSNLPLNGILSTEYGWMALAGQNLVLMAPSPQSASWTFALQLVGGASATAQGHSFVHHQGTRYVFSMYDDLGTDGCLGIAEYSGGGWLADCRIHGLRRASGIASDGHRVAVRSSDDASNQDVVSLWNPDTNELTPIARMPYRGRQSVAIDGAWVYFDGVASVDSQAFFRCSKDADPETPPVMNPACETIVEIASASAQSAAIAAVGSSRIDVTTAAERSLVCWVDGTNLTCTVTR